MVRNTFQDRSSMQASFIWLGAESPKPIAGSTGSEMAWTAERFDAEARKLSASQVFLAKAEASFNHKGCLKLLELLAVLTLELTVLRPAAGPLSRSCHRPPSVPKTRDRK